MSEATPNEKPEAIRKALNLIGDTWPRFNLGDAWHDLFVRRFKDETWEDLQRALEAVKLSSDGIEPELSQVVRELEEIKQARLGVSIFKNIAKVKALWPSAGLKAEWISLFRREFENKNPVWVDEAIDAVKKQRSSHVPEIKWFVDAFEERRAAESRKTRAATTQPESFEELLDWLRSQPISKEERARLKEEWLAREREEVEAERMKIRHWMADLHPSAIDQIREAMRKIDFLRTLAKGTERPVSDWPAFTLGMAHAVAIRDGIGGAR